MIPNAAIRNLIREEKVHQIYSQMQVGQPKFGMQTMSQSLARSVQRHLITLDEAIGARDRARRAEARCSAPGAAAGPRRAGSTLRTKEERRMAVFQWAGRLAAAARRCKGEMEATTREAVITRLRAQRIQPHPGEDQGEGQGARHARSRIPASARAVKHARHRGLHAPVRHHDRRRPADRAVPRHPRGADRQQGLPQASSASVKDDVESGSTLRRRRCASTPRSSTTSTPTWSRPARSAASSTPSSSRLADLHGEGRQAEEQDQGRDDLPGAASSRPRSSSPRILLVWVIPVFAELFSSFGQALPAPTQFVINLSNFTIAYIWLIIVGAHRRDRRRCAADLPHRARALCDRPLRCCACRSSAT